MKQLLLFILVLSCAPKGATVNSVAPSAPAENQESNIQKPQIPIEGCNCIKIFRPVCAQGRTFGNSCEAECHGFKKWTQGSCK